MVLFDYTYRLKRYGSVTSCPSSELLWQGIVFIMEDTHVNDVTAAERIVLAPDFCDYGILQAFGRNTQRTSCKWVASER